METKENKKLYKSSDSKDLRTKKLGESMNGFVHKLKKISNSIYDVVLNNEKDFWVIFFLALGSLGIMIYLSMRVYSNNAYINQMYMELGRLEKYKISESLKSNQSTRGFSTIDDMIDYYVDLNEEKSKYDRYIKELSTSYQYLLQYIYLPRLNIWKDLYIDNIHTDLIGIRFIKNNPYTDSALINRWTSFFQYVGENNENNRVLDMSVGDFEEDNKGFFKIPISLSFESSSKRSFLLLLDKLLITSNQSNVSLINEFMYYLIQNIKSDKSQEIGELVESLNLKYEGNYFVDEKGSDNINKIIGYAIYNWLYGDLEIDIIDDFIINKTVKDVASCPESLDINVCHYRFREKYRNIPEMAYNIGRLIMDVDRTEYLKSFLSNLPPIISIKDLSFDKVRLDNFIGLNAMRYKGRISIDVFGKGITDYEVKEISSVLGEKCLGDGILLDPNVALKKIDDYIAKLSSIDTLDFGKSRDMWELNDIIGNIAGEYDGLTNYNKIIRIFEIYRMLDDAVLCTNW